MMLRLALVLVGGLLVVGCNLLFPATDAGNGGNGGAGPIDGEWRLTDGTHDGRALPVPNDADVTMTIAGEEVGGRAACNSYGGNVSVDGDRLTIGAMSMTEMGCDPALMDAESAFVAALADVERWSRTAEQLTLTGDRVELTFELVPAMPDADLTGTQWVLDGLVDGDAVSSTLAGADPATLELADDGTLTGSTGCRAFTGRWVLEGATVVVTDVTTTDQACPDLASQDEHVLAIIESGFDVAITGDRLTATSDGLGLTYLARDE